MLLKFLKPEAWKIEFLFFFSPSRMLILLPWKGDTASGEFEAERSALPLFPNTSSSPSSIQISGTPPSIFIPLGTLFVLLESFTDSSPQIVTSIFGIGTELLRNLVGAERPSLLSVHAIPFNLIFQKKRKLLPVLLMYLMNLPSFLRNEKRH